MGFFQKVKLWLGMGGVKVSLSVPETIEKGAGSFSGAVTLTSKSDLELLELKLELIESWSTGRGEEKQTKELTLGSMTLNLNRAIKAGETQTVPFDLAFSYSKSENEAMAEKGGVMGALGKVGQFAQGEKSTFEVKAMMNVKGVGLDPSDSKSVKLV